MKRNMLSIVAVLVFAVLVAGVAYAHGNQGNWCTGDSGWNHMGASHMGNMMGSSSGHMMGSYAEHMGPADEHMGPNAGHMGPSSPDRMTARHDGKNRDFDCPGWDAGDKNAGSDVEQGN